MAIVTSNTTDDSHGGTSIYIDGHLFSVVTKETGQGPIDKFIQLIEANKDELAALVTAQVDRRNWNMANPGKGRDWPAFRNIDRAKAKLAKAAGIVDS